VDEKGNCNCGRQARKPLKMRIVDGKRVYLDDDGKPVDPATLAPPPVKRVREITP
jgi:hypothetical protein